MSLSRAIVKTAFLAGLVCLAGWYFFKRPQAKPEADHVNVYCWHGLIDREIVKEFERETGITVRLDSYDNNEVLEARLLAGNSGFDAVFPSASPYLGWQIQAGVYEPLDKALLPNVANLDPFIAKFTREIDKDLTFALPYFWGTVGIVHDEDVLDEIFPKGYERNLGLLFSVENLKRLAPRGVSLLEEGVDVIPLALEYLKLSPVSSNKDDLNAAALHLAKMRPYIGRFTSSKVVNDIVLGDTCVALTWSGEANQAIREAQAQGKNIKFFIPPEGTILWIDAVAIPKGAPHPKNAHAFIDFLFRPDIAAKICRNSAHGIAVTGIKKFLEPAIRDNRNIFPDQSILKKLFINPPPKDAEQIAKERERTRVWAKIRLNEYKG